MGKTGALGAFEELVLMALVRLGPAAYTVGVRPRRFYAIEEAEVEALARSRSVRDRMWEGVELSPASEPGGRS